MNTMNIEGIVFQNIYIKLIVSLLFLIFSTQFDSRRKIGVPNNLPRFPLHPVVPDSKNAVGQVKVGLNAAVVINLVPLGGARFDLEITIVRACS